MRAANNPLPWQASCRAGVDVPASLPDGGLQNRMSFFFCVKPVRPVPEIQNVVPEHLEGRHVSYIISMIIIRNDDESDY